MSKIREVVFQGDAVNNSQITTQVDSLKSLIELVSTQIGDKALGMVASIVAIAVLYIAFSLLFAFGDDDKVKIAKTNAIYIAAGILLIVFAVLIINIIVEIPDMIFKG